MHNACECLCACVFSAVLVLGCMNESLSECICYIPHSNRRAELNVACNTLTVTRRLAKGLMTHNLLVYAPNV